MEKSDAAIPEDMPLEVTEYLASMDTSHSVHYRNNTFSPGDAALLKADFDNNPKTKKRKLDAFYQAEVEIEEILQNNRIKVKKTSGEVVVVRASQLRKAIRSE